MATISTPRLSSPSGTPRIKSPSNADTPTSSTRGSIDLNHRPAASTASTPQPAPRRNRAALRDYYNLKSKPSPQLPSSTTGNLSRTASIASIASETSTAPSLATLTDTTSPLTAQLDATDFDAPAYIYQLLATSSLRDILKVEATLVSEIRNLDGERKALVYDNYSKLIKAVGTIGEMQRGMNDNATGGLREVGALEEKMEALRVAVGLLAVEREGESIREERGRRKEVRESEKKKEVVKRVLRAPEKLQGLVEEGKVEDAEREWEFVRGYLDAWQGVKGATEVRARCEEIMTRSESDGEND